jgi:hypothetical protein
LANTTGSEQNNKTQVPSFLSKQAYLDPEVTQVLQIEHARNARPHNTLAGVTTGNFGKHIVDLYSTGNGNNRKTGDAAYMSP